MATGVKRVQAVGVPAIAVTEDIGNGEVGVTTVIPVGRVFALYALNDDRGVTSIRYDNGSSSVTNVRVPIDKVMAALAWDGPDVPRFPSN